MEPRTTGAHCNTGLQRLITRSRPKRRKGIRRNTGFMIANRTSGALVDLLLRRAATGRQTVLRRIGVRRLTLRPAVGSDAARDATNGLPWTGNRQRHSVRGSHRRKQQSALAQKS
ncbi:hypothetical protein ACWC5I_46030 [Kitasatospora sp. NPDC001574]